MKIKVSDFIANFFVSKGVKDVFTITGGGAMHLNDSFGHHPELKSYYQHHEQACAIAAESYARMTGNLPLVCVTSGPGGTNALTGVLGAWLDSIPMFVISGQVKRETTIKSTDIKLRQLGDQEFNITDCVNSMTKYSQIVMHENEILFHLEEAWNEANSGRKGPVWLDIPLDVQAAIIDTDQLIRKNNVYTDTQTPIYDELLSPKIIDKINNSKKPVVFVGSGIRLADANKEFIQLIEKLNIPVVTAWNAHDTLWDDHPLFCGRPGTIGTRGGNFVVENADLLLVLGSRLNIRQISYNFRNFAKNAFKIMVDIDQNELLKPTLSIDFPIHANVKDVLISLNKYLSLNTCDNKFDNWLRWCRETNNKYPVVRKEYYQNNEYVNPYIFMDKCFNLLNENQKVVTSNGSACVISFQAAKIKKGQRLYTNSGCASMGYGLPAAIGANIATGEKIICFEGDGSLQMNIQELQTIKHYNLDIVLFVLNNNGYHSIRQTQKNLTKKDLIGVCSDNGVSFPELEKIAYAYDIKYKKIDNHSKLDEILNNVLREKGPILCEVILDVEQNFEPKLSSKVLEDGTIVSPRIDDMFPFLDREEYESIKFGE